MVRAKQLGQGLIAAWQAMNKSTVAVPISLCELQSLLDDPVCKEAADSSYKQAKS